MRIEQGIEQQELHKEPLGLDGVEAEADEEGFARPARVAIIMHDAF